MEKIPYFFLLILLLVMVGEVQCRFLRHNSPGLVSDGMSHGNSQPPFLLLLPRKDDDASESCRHIYGFLPCTDTIVGHLFLILVYEYLLFLGESFVSLGNEMIFHSLGTGFFGASAFHILRAIPDNIFAVVSGLSKSKEVAQEQVVMGVGSLAGSTILFLTLLWGTCVFAGSTSKDSEPSASKNSKPSASHDSPSKKRLSVLTGSCVTIEDEKTNHIAKIMVSSLIPFIILLLQNFLSSSSWESLGILIALILSTALLLVYIVYQVHDPWIQGRSLEYVKHKHLMTGILNHVQRHALGNLLTKDGQPNISVMKSLFQTLDQDGNTFISKSEIAELIPKIEFGEGLDKDDVVSQVMKKLDKDGDNQITENEFIAGCTNLVPETQHGMSDKSSHLKDSNNHLHEVGQFRTEEKGKNNTIAGLLRHAQSLASEDLLTNDGTPNIACIRRLFEKFDLDGDKRISYDELKRLIAGTTFKNVKLGKDILLEMVLKEVDENGDKMVNEEEFVNAFTKWIAKIKEEAVQKGSYLNGSLEDHLKVWEEADELMDEKKPGGASIQSLLVWLKSISFLLFGIAISFLLSEPLIASVENFSSAANIPSFFITFVIVPLATKSAEALSLINSASHKKPVTINLAFSEIYGAVFMQNILSLFAILSLVYARGLTWDFSAEVLVIVLVCAIIGLMAGFRKILPIWTCCIAYLLYPLSLLLVYVLK